MLELPPFLPMFSLCAAVALKSFGFYWWLSSEEKSWKGAFHIGFRSLAAAMIGCGYFAGAFGRSGLIGFTAAYSILLTSIYLFVDANGYLPDFAARRFELADIAQALIVSLRRVLNALARCSWDFIFAVLIVLRGDTFDRGPMLELSLVGIALWLLLACTLSFRNKGRDALWALPVRSERAVYLYGICVAQLAWWLQFVPDADPARSEPIPEYRLNTNSRPLPELVAAIQLESVGSAVVEELRLFRHLTDLTRRQHGLVISECQMFRGAGGTSDSEFAVLTGLRPPETGAGAFRTGMPSALPRLCAASGYTSYVLHGNTGLFYDRARWYREIGFNVLKFRDSFVARPGRWGVEDDDLLREAGDLVIRPDRPAKMFMFNILMSTHYPYNLFGRKKIGLEAYPDAMNLTERFKVSCDYVEQSVLAFVGRLQQAKSFVCILYGDHPPGVAVESVVKPGENRNHSIPVWLITKGLTMMPSHHPNVTLLDVGATLAYACGGEYEYRGGRSLLTDVRADSAAPRHRASAR